MIRSSASRDLDRKDGGDEWSNEIPRTPGLPVEREPSHEERVMLILTIAFAVVVATLGTGGLIASITPHRRWHVLPARR
jgi:hypothetical protein